MTGPIESRLEQRLIEESIERDIDFYIESRQREPEQMELIEEK